MVLSEEEKNIIKRNLLIKEKLEKQRQQKLLQEIIESTTYKKGEIEKEVFKFPMPSSAGFLDNKQLNVKTYGALMLQSNWGGKFLNPTTRYIYKDKWDIVLDDICDDLKISKSTIKRHINKLKKCDIKAVELCKKFDGDLFYILNYGIYTEHYDEVKFEKFVTISNVALRKLVNSYSEYALRIYLVFLYKCYEGECYMTQDYICKKIGLESKSRVIVTDCIDALEKGGFIQTRVEYGSIGKKNIDGDLYEQVIPKYYYSLCEDYLKSKRELNKRKREAN